MFILGLTGSIGMGKSTVADNFRYLGIAVYDADKVVHQILANDNKAIKAIKTIFPGVVEDGVVNRKILAKQVFGDQAALQNLEQLLHPLVSCYEQKFLFHAALQRRPLVVLDIPLLFETEAEKRCNAVAVVLAPHFVQEARIFRRRGMSQKRLAFIRSRQMPDAVKRQKADFIINTGLSRAFNLRMVRKIIKIIS